MALDDNPLYHCSNLQGVILGVGLSMLENLFAQQSREGSSVKTPDAKNAKKRKAESTATTPASNSNYDDDEDDTYFGVNKGGKKAKGGIGYAGAVREDVIYVMCHLVCPFSLLFSQNTGQIEAASAQKAKDENMAGLLTAVRAFLPNLRREGGGKASDYLVHPTTLAHLRRRFNYVSSTLLRNDSLADMSDRNVLYFELFVWLEVSDHVHGCLLNVELLGRPFRITKRWLA